jgi:hypothetical protein
MNVLFVVLSMMNNFRSTLFKQGKRAFVLLLVDPISTISNTPINDQWDAFKNRMDDFGLHWEVNERSTKVDFMDLTIEIKGLRLTTTLYQKAMNLIFIYYHIPPILQEYLPDSSTEPSSVSNVYALNLRIDAVYNVNSFNACLLEGTKHQTLLHFFKRQRAVLKTQKTSNRFHMTPFSFTSPIILTTPAQEKYRNSGGLRLSTNPSYL